MVNRLAVDLENFPAENFLANARTEGESLRCVKRSASRSLREVGRRMATRRDCQTLHQRRCVKISRNNPLRPPLHGGHLSQRERQDGFSGTARLSSLKKELPPGCEFSAIGRCFLCYCCVIRVYPKGFTSKSLPAVVNRRAVDTENSAYAKFSPVIVAAKFSKSAVCGRA